MKKIPMRTCLSCREKKPKKELIRILLNEENGLTADLTGKKNGRGAYVCNSATCVDKLNVKSLSAALKSPVSERMIQEIKASLEDSVK
ncbi:MAG: YlxR family protein, partial [Eubacteriaceae bacterium]|nr:YlxR family protein [Eubacteriaceae bacterium]